jgi:hypothetical protein
MKVYRLYTENIQRTRWEIMDLVSHEFSGFTVLDVVGYWKGVAERAIVIEIIAEGGDRTRGTIMALAKRIREINDQECVMMTVQDVEMELID